MAGSVTIKIQIRWLVPDAGYELVPSVSRNGDPSRGTSASQQLRDTEMFRHDASSKWELVSLRRRGKKGGYTLDPRRRMYPKSCARARTAT